jgi:hypothetical protein
MIKDKKLGMEMPENETERMWFNLREKLKMELSELEDSIKPKNRIKELEKIKQIIKMNKELIKTCDSHLIESKGGKRK